MGAVASRNLDSGHEWATPRDFMAGLSARYGPFDLDPCATPENAKAPRFFTKADDGLAQPWRCSAAFVNPPYGRKAGRSVHGTWAEKCHDAWASGEAGRVVALLPAATDTSWFHDHAMKAAHLEFVRGRLRFNDGPSGGTFPSLVVVWDGDQPPGPPTICAIDRQGRVIHPLPPEQRSLNPT